MNELGSGCDTFTACGRLREQPAAARPRLKATHPPWAGGHGEPSSEPVGARPSLPIASTIGETGMPQLAGNRPPAPKYD